MPSPARPAAAAADDATTLVITRVFDAPRDAVFKAWTDPAQVARWKGPRGVQAEVEQMDARAGGGYRVAMHGTPNGTMVVRGVYREVVPPERLVFTWAWEDDAATHRAGHETLVTVTLRAIGRRTELTLRHDNFDSAQSRDGHGYGWNGSFDKLAEFLAQP
ncbi:MAG TPA: SRPBCC domain-containing protein [Stellaceae bacterium]|nr:SRPBCC domain-containing protein [Stellaceae bacterium]